MRHIDGQDFKDKNGYEINGTWFPRVTRILEIKSKPALEHFFKEMGSFESAEAVKTKSAQEGSLVHEIIGRIAIGETPEVPETIRPRAEAFERFQESRKIIFHPEFIERQVWSGAHRYAGTIDALVSFDGKFGVLDIKTSAGFYPEYNLQTAAYMQALGEYEVARMLQLPRPVQTRWILRVDQQKICTVCGARLREKGGRSKVRSVRSNGSPQCGESEHRWGEPQGEVELREFPYFYKDVKAFLAAKTLWEWENDYWLRQIGYLAK